MECTYEDKKRDADVEMFFNSVFYRIFSKAICHSVVWIILSMKGIGKFLISFFNNKIDSFCFVVSLYVPSTVLACIMWF